MSNHCDKSMIKVKEDDKEEVREFSSLTLTDNDVLLGRGGNVFKHVGNQNLKRLCYACIHKYNEAHKCQKLDIAKIIWNQIKAMDPPGRFLRKPGRVLMKDSCASDSWVEVSEEVGI